MSYNYSSVLSGVLVLLNICLCVTFPSVHSVVLFILSGILVCCSERAN